MTAQGEKDLVGITIVVIVYIDPNDEELWDVIRSSPVSRFEDVVRSEIRSNLESVSYVRHLEIA